MALIKRFRRATQVSRPRSPQAGHRSFPIVGIDAAAGGLAAFTQLLGTLPQNTGLAFVLVQHLDAKHASMLTAQLPHATTLPVHVRAPDGFREGAKNRRPRRTRSLLNFKTGMNAP